MKYYNLISFKKKPKPLQHFFFLLKKEKIYNKYILFLIILFYF